MKINPKVIKIISVFLALDILQSAICPGISYALTSGPSMPEYSSFEPVDTKDMVNLFSGDLTYNIPLLNVPSPEGGYPLSLSYHAGIELNQEASWVGLGWSLNPGAINRSSVIYPDDYNGNNISSYFNNNGGGGYSIGAGYGPFGAHLTNDSEKGWGGAVSLGIGQYASVGLNTHGTNSAGNGTGSAPGVGVSAGISYNDATGFSAYGGASLGGGAFSTGMTLSSAGLNSGGSFFGQSIGGVSGKSAASASDWKFTSSGFYFPILNTGAWLSYSDYRYFLQATKNENAYGMLYYQNAPNFEPCCYSGSSSLEFYQKTNNSNSYQNTNMVTYSPDIYSVAGQGISGNIRPYRTSNGSVAIIDNGIVNGASAQYKTYKKFSSGKPAFRYTNEPSNDFQYHYDPTKFNIDYVFSSNYGDHTETVPEPLVQNNPPNDLKQNNGRLSSGKFIEWFSNLELINDPTLINDPLTTSARAKFPSDGIGAMRITNIDGTVYTYAIPVYNTYQLNHSEDPNRATNFNYNYTELKTPYAYSWLLTSVNGSDYVDRGVSGKFDNADWGYWIRFDYGKWTDYYHWRSPYDSFAENMRNAFKSLSYGNKQIYYLNRITTRSHTALFVKEPRSDGKGTSAYWEFTTSGNALHGIYDGGGKQLGPRVTTLYPNGSEASVGTERHIAASLMRLNKILLFKNEDLLSSNLTESKGTPIDDYYPDLHYANGNHNTPIGSLSTTNQIFESDKLHLYNNVLDINDLSSSNINISKAIKTIEFKSDYTLCQDVPNNFDTDVDMKTILDTYSNPIWSISNPITNAGGKLTLKEIQIKGKAGVNIMPSTIFEYANNPNFDKNKWDGWGMYSSIGQSDKNTHKSTYEGTEWSLSKITTPLGGEININYDRDRYQRTANETLNNSNAGNILQITPLGEITSKSPYSLNDVFSVGDQLHVSGKIYIRIEGNPGEPPISVSSEDFSINVTIQNIISNSLTVTPSLSSALNLIDNYPTHRTIYQYTTSGSPKFRLGGDIRVSCINTKDEIGNTYASNYFYTMDGTINGFSSGIASQEPEFIGGNADLELNSVSPMVGYSKVTIKTVGTDGSSRQGKKVYEFNNLDGNSVKINRQFYQDQVIKQPTNSSSGWSVYSSGWLEENRAAFIGTPKSAHIYSNLGQLLNGTDYEYYQAPPIGTITEGINMDVVEPFETNNKVVFHHRIVRSTRISYPSILKSLKITQDGITKTVTNNAFDFYTGNVTESEINNSFGEKYKTISVPAYTIPAYSSMGSKVDGGRNMLTQEAANYTYAVDASNTSKLISANVQTWANSWIYREIDVNNVSAYMEVPRMDVWRKHQSYVWKSPVNADGTINPLAFQDYWANPSNDSWQKTSEVARYDHYSKPVEVKDINGNFVSSKMGYNESYAIASAANSNYTGFAYSGAEDVVLNNGVPTNYFGGEVLGADQRFTKTMLLNGYSQTMPVNGYAHTGNYCLKFEGGSGFQYKASVGDLATADFKRGKTYRANVWVYNNPDAQFGALYCILRKPDNSVESSKYVNTASTSTKLVGKFYLLSLDIDIPAGSTASNIEVGAGIPPFSSLTQSPVIYFDDFRVHAVDAPMTSYVYDEQRGLVTAILDNENFATKFYYDNAGRLIRTDKETLQGFKKVSETTYHYGRQ